MTIAPDWKAARVEATQIVMHHILTDDAIRSDANYADQAARYARQDATWFTTHRHAMELDIKRNALSIVIPLLAIAEKRGVAVIDSYLQRTDPPDPAQLVRRQLSQAALAAVRPKLA
jgi:hypothetical protein